jgi:hypothetical protein
MLRSFRVLWLTACCAALPTAVEAQLGGFLYKLQKLSGPEMVSYAPFVRVGYQPGQLLGARDIDALPDFSGTERFAQCVAQIRSSPGRTSRTFYNESRVDRIRSELGQLRADIQAAARRGAPDDRQRTLLEAAACRIASNLTILTTDTRERDPMHGLVLRPGVSFGWDVGDPNTAIKMIVLEPNLEYRFLIDPISLNLGLETGLNVHRFFGNDIDDFTHLSVPVLVNWHPFARWRSGLLRNIRVGYGIRIFPAFDADAFAPAIPDIEEGTEIVWLDWPLISLDISATAIPFLFSLDRR